MQGERGEKGDAGPIGLPVKYQIIIKNHFEKV